MKYIYFLAEFVYIMSNIHDVLYVCKSIKKILIPLEGEFFTGTHYIKYY